LLTWRVLQAVYARRQHAARVRAALRWLPNGRA
jgi:hypothetical protein